MEIDAKEKTAQGSSVGADEGQSNQKSTLESIPVLDEKINETDEKSKPSMRERARLRQKMMAPEYLPTVTLQTLFDTAYQSKPPVIEGLLYTGTYLFAGAPKVGKSFLVAQIAYHVSTGQDLWEYKVNPGTVLYLALEDDHRRLQERMYRMFGVEGTDRLHFATDAKQLGNGLDEQLEYFIKEHPDTRLVIIDTLQKVRESAGDGYSYSEDYQIIGSLKQFADKHGICLLIVHHTRKTPAGDKFDMISGTTGLLGCADGAFVLQKEKRTNGTAMLDVVGRDQPDQRVYLVRDEERLIWEFDHAEKELWKEPPDPLLEKVAALLTAEAPTWQGSATELIAALGLELQANALTKRLNVRASKLFNDFNIRYENTHGRNGSRISLALAAAQT